MAWNPEQYDRFKAERAQPFHDLLALIERRPRMQIVDFGCGTGELTRELHEQLGAKETIGIDNSETMLLRSGGLHSEVLRFEKGDIEAYVTDRPYDLVFSNAALHWIPDHEKLFTRLASFLGPRGQIAIQMPFNDDHPSHAIAADVAREMRAEPRRAHVLSPERYAALLHKLGFKHQHVRLQVYGHELPSAREVVNWNRGALLTDYETKLGERFPKFLETYTERLLRALDPATPFFYSYKRILMWASF